ncbi:endonuclease/exonuclease/phosphatase family protein [Chromohalobacter sp. TMW 2.2308]|uniref:Endonuclease/exonuclease/phosphatase family protein n=1 Tax=Chromohalobacter moromii TaxID=2860329 RepID=A0A9X2X3C7_9GAMM|nr:MULTISPECIES: endonuclease/exonuclease/phosphatase family protein [Chromohalobacter]MCK2043855.1 endonuclease/exonuclease/phosphatase family protein [Chromohalobacter moromii]MCK2046460.1 endonuclease/exonuclease/phosphatase family protein [Chromohalobacter moromii]MCT8469617.1 endonuclease/exonuclease/phosphatase family protein [Chromohalobacter canadensis]MCT8472241.1 endonuclease/exonuclease/phosphatase family protein [Chromohalobacter canadensis]MCT8499647.1 endonuclease/exonuclease/pho
MMIEYVVEIVLALLALIAFIATAIPWLNLRYWWVRGFDFPRLQLAALAAVIFIALLGVLPWSSLGWMGAIASLIVLGMQGTRIFPWTPLATRQVVDAEGEDASRQFSLLVANVLTPNRQATSLMRQIHEADPDIVLTLESDAWWEERLDEALSESHPHTVKIPLDNLYGMHLYSRLALHEPHVEWLIQDDIPSIHGWFELPGGEHVRFHAVHPRPPAPGESDESLWRDAELLLVGQTVRDSDQPTLVAGDLNDVAWSKTTRLFCRISGMLDPRQGRGLYSTFHAEHRWLRWPLDHVFVSEHFTLVALRRLSAFGSDHFPILTTFRYRPARANENDSPDADREERQDAEETIEEAQDRRGEEPIKDDD